MPGKHAASDNSQFYRDLVWFGLRWLIGAVIVFGAAWFLTSQVFGSDDPGSSAAPTTIQAPTIPTTLPPVTTTEATPPPPPTTRPPATTAPTGSTAPTATTTSTVAPTTTVTTAPEPELPPSEITVRVLNSTGRRGLAATVTAQLRALGYVMRLQDNYGTRLQTTTVFYVPGFAEEAATLAAELAGATTTAPNPAAEPSADLLVVLGSSYP